MKEIDARGLACPAPVLQTKAAIENDGADAVTVIVDNEASRQNVCRFLASQQFSAEVRAEGNEFHITGRRSGDAAAAPAQRKADAPRAAMKILIMVSADRFGRGDDDLGGKLMTNFLKTINEIGSDLWRLVFVNSGVKLTIDGSAALSDLQALEADGVKILVCGTCLDHFGLLDRKQAGETTNMLDIVTAFHLADKVINL